MVFLFLFLKSSNAELFIVLKFNCKSKKEVKCSTDLCIKIIENIFRISRGVLCGVFKIIYIKCSAIEHLVWVRLKKGG